MNILEAELLGMHAGDGTLYRTNSGSVVWELRGGLDEISYYSFVSELLKRIFKIEFVPKYRAGGGNGSFGIQTSKKEVTSFISSYFPVGSKSRIAVIPSSIFTGNKSVKCAFLRGLFDTDGCVRFDKNHTARNYYPKIELSTASVKLRDEVKILLGELGIGCYVWNSLTRSEYRLCVPGLKNLQRWSELIGWHNPKHLYKVVKVLFS